MIELHKELQIILQENNTHKAILNGNKIDIIAKGFIDGDFELKEEFLYSIPKENKDDLFEIFEIYDEDNRINLNENYSESVCNNLFTVFFYKKFLAGEV